MKRIEISYRSNVAELSKLNARLERAQKNLEKKKAIAEKYGVAEWTCTEHTEWIKTVAVDEWHCIINKADVQKNGAWIEYESAKSDIQEIESEIASAEKRFAKVEEALETYHKEVQAITDAKQREAMQQLEFEQEQKEWAKDGITLENRYYGKTPKGKWFIISGNCGITMRSRHCYTLTIDGNTIFTSGEFWRAYCEIKKR